MLDKSFYKGMQGRYRHAATAPDGHSVQSSAPRRLPGLFFWAQQTTCRVHGLAFGLRYGKQLSFIMTIVPTTHHGCHLHAKLGQRKQLIRKKVHGRPVGAEIGLDETRHRSIDQNALGAKRLLCVAYRKWSR